LYKYKVLDTQFTENFLWLIAGTAHATGHRGGCRLCMW